MKVRIRLILSGLITIMSLILLYALMFSAGMDAADYAWPYSYLHFLLMWKEIGLILMVMLGILLLLSCRDVLEDNLRLIFNIGFTGVLLLYFNILSNLFFSLNRLSRTGHYSYQPFTQNSFVNVLSILGLLFYFISLIILLLKYKQVEME